jgi:uncharacterized membrane protein
MKNILLKSYNRFLWHLKELNKTLSNEPSYYSSKRLERLVLFVSANLIVDYYVWEHHSEMTTSDILLVFGAKMVYAGFQVKQIQKDIKNESTTTE